MNVYIIVGAIIAVAIIVLSWFFYRRYKDVGRRCKCGNIHMERKCKIILAPDEVVSYHSSNGKWRWWIRRVVKLTFTICHRKDKHEGHDLTTSVKFDYDPISVFHAKWVQKHNNRQYYYTELELIEAAQRRIRELYLGGRYKDPDLDASRDTPPLSLESLFKDYFEKFTNDLDELTNMVIGNGETK